jgi:hypothetical protein
VPAKHRVPLMISGLTWTTELVFMSAIKPAVGLMTTHGFGHGASVVRFLPATLRLRSSSPPPKERQACDPTSEP